MTDKVNEWGLTYRQWGRQAHDELVMLTGLGLGDVQEMCDLGSAWMDGWCAEDFVRELELLPPDEIEETFGNE